MNKSLDSKPEENYQKQFSNWLFIQKSKRLDDEVFIQELKNQFPAKSKVKGTKLFKLIYDKKMGDALKNQLNELIKDKKYEQLKDSLELIKLLYINDLLTEDQVQQNQKKVELILNKCDMNLKNYQLEPSTISKKLLKSENPNQIIQFLEQFEKTKENPQNIEFSQIFKDVAAAYQSGQLQPQQIDKLQELFLFYRNYIIKQKKFADEKNRFLQQILGDHQVQNRQIIELNDYFKIISSELMGINWEEFGIQKNQIQLGKFGSIVNGFAISSSDMDLAILTSSYVNERKFLRLLGQILKNKLDYNKFTIEMVTNEAIRIPLITLKIKDIAIDLIVNNLLGIINAQLLSTYSKIDERVEQLGKLAKLWAKAWKVSSKKNLSSYAITLMVIYFLQQKGIVPVLQEISVKKEEIKIKRQVKDQFQEFATNIQFETDQKIIQKELFAKNMEDYEKYEEANQETLYDLFLGFLNCYKKDGLILLNNIQIDISSSKKTFAGSGDPETSNYLYSIIDPFDKMHNPGDKVKKMDSDKNDPKKKQPNNESLLIYEAFSQSIEYMQISRDIKAKLIPKQKY